MLDFGWQEFLVVAIVTVLFVGPKELPRVFRTITGLMRKARSMAGEFHRAMDEMAREADLQDIKKEVTKVKDGTSDWKREIDPTGEVGASLKSAKSEFDAARTSVNQAGREAKAGTGKAAADETAESTASTTPKPQVSEETAAPAKDTGDKKAVAKKAASKSASSKTAIKKASAKTASAKKASAKKASAKPAEPTPEAGKKAAGKKAAGKKGVAKNGAAKTVTAKGDAS